MRILDYRIKKTLDGNAKMRINSKNAHKKTYAHIWVGYIFYPVWKNAHKLWWKHIYRINSSMRIEKVMWLCAMRRDNLTNQLWLISFTASICCYGHSEKPEQSLSSKYFCIIVLHDCVLKQLASTSESNNRIYCVSSARSEVQVICHIWKLLYSVASPVFLVIFSATVYQEVTILFSLTRWMETSFEHKFNSNLWMET